MYFSLVYEADEEQVIACKRGFFLGHFFLVKNRGRFVGHMHKKKRTNKRSVEGTAFLLLVSFPPKTGLFSSQNRSLFLPKQVSFPFVTGLFSLYIWSFFHRLLISFPDTTGPFSFYSRSLFLLPPAANKGFTQIYHRDLTTPFGKFSYEIGEKFWFRISVYG